METSLNQAFRWDVVDSCPVCTEYYTMWIGAGFQLEKCERYWVKHSSVLRSHGAPDPSWVKKGRK